MPKQQGNHQRTARVRALRSNPPEPERVLWQRLRASQCGVQFRRQHPVGPYVLDFCAPAVKLAIEVDGDTHYETMQVRARDVERDAFLVAGGFRVLRFTNREVMENVDGVCDEIRGHLSTKKQDAPLPPQSPLPPQTRRGGRQEIVLGLDQTADLLKLRGGRQEIVLGLDPGVARLGYGVLRIDGLSDVCVTFGCIETPKGPLGPRLVALREQLTQIVALHQPDRIVIEQLFFSKNVKTATMVGEARGVILLTCAESGIATVEVSPQDVKLAVCGYGRADKQQVQRMVMTLLKLDAIPQPDDAADALAVALAGARRHLTIS